MKTLYLVRHAKSDWKNEELADIDRPLNERGYRDAHFMGNLMLARKHIPELMITSPAIRAISTALIFSRILKLPPSAIQIKDGIYEAGKSEIIGLLHGLDDQIHSVMLFGHNPTFTEVTNLLIDQFIDNVPTTGIIGVRFNITSWSNLEKEKGQLQFFEFPKNHSEYVK